MFRISSVRIQENNNDARDPVHDYNSLLAVPLLVL
jgi:hypothetical protein